MSISAHQLVTALRYLVLGPVWLLPMAVWRRLSRQSRQLSALLAMPGVYACGMFCYGAVQQWPLQAIGPSVREGLRSYSPLHVCADQLTHLGILLQTVPWYDRLLAAGAAWAVVTVMCTAFVSPLYLWLATSRR